MYIKLYMKGITKMKIIKLTSILLISLASVFGCSSKETHKNTAGIDNNTKTEERSMKDNIKKGVKDAGNTVGNVTEDIGEGVENITEEAGKSVKDITNQ